MKKLIVAPRNFVSAPKNHVSLLVLIKPVFLLHTFLVLGVY